MAHMSIELRNIIRQGILILLWSHVWVKVM